MRRVLRFSSPHSLLTTYAELPTNTTNLRSKRNSTKTKNSITLRATNVSSKMSIYIYSVTKTTIYHFNTNSVLIYASSTSSTDAAAKPLSGSNRLQVVAGRVTPTVPISFNGSTAENTQRKQATMAQDMQTYGGTKYDGLLIIGTNRKGNGLTRANSLGFSVGTFCLRLNTILSGA